MTKPRSNGMVQTSREPLGSGKPTGAQIKQKILTAVAARIFVR